MSVLNPGPEVTPLKFRSWLRTEAADIDRMTRATNLAHQASIIRIFLPDRLRVAIGQAKLDRIIQDVVNQFETIIRVELQVVAGPGAHTSS